MRKSRLLILFLVALLPSFLKRPLYRLFFGYQIGRRVRIGVSLIDARQCSMADDAGIGHLNLFIGVKKLQIGDHVRIGHLNIVPAAPIKRLSEHDRFLIERKTRPDLPDDI